MRRDCTYPVLGAVFGLALGLLPLGAAAQTLVTGHLFSGGTDGSNPYRGVTLDSRAGGRAFGTSFYGGTDCPDSYLYPGVGCGTLWKIDQAGHLNTLVTFLGASNGADPESDLTLRGNTLYGGTSVGGAANQGTLFSVSVSGTGFKTLYSFNGSDGQHPDSIARFDSAGNLYTVTRYGGPGYVSGQDLTGSGVLLEITAAGAYIAQHDFSGGTDGGQPGRIFFDSAGTIYGATSVGGACTGTGLPTNGCGVVYQFVPSTGQFTLLHNFSGSSDGYTPALGGFDGKGNLYGVTEFGGADGYGTIFKLAPSGSGGFTYVHLYDFTGGADGAYAINPFVEPSGTLIGTTEYGPVVSSTELGAGVLYKFSGGTLQTLYTFLNDSHGGYPFGTPNVDLTTGTIYGTTAYGGTTPCNTSTGTLISTFGCGTIYRFTP